MSRKKKIRFIEDHIGDCLIEDRAVILNIIVQRIGNKSLYEENTGIRILYKKIPLYIIEEIHEYIFNSMKKNKIPNI